MSIGYGSVIRGTTAQNAGHWAMVVCEGDLDGTPNPGRVACLCWEEGRPGRPYLGTIREEWIGDSWEIVQVRGYGWVPRKYDPAAGVTRYRP